MPTLIVRCPNTGHHVSTGIIMDAGSFHRLPDKLPIGECSVCGGQHTLLKCDAVFSDDDWTSLPSAIIEIASQGSCHCGAVNLTVSRPPREVTECHCSICIRYGALWAYYRAEDVSLAGPTQVYEWGRKQIAFHHCGTCGCVMAWLPLGEYPECGVNARMLHNFNLRAVSLIVEKDASI